MENTKVKIHTLADTADIAADTFKVYSSEKPDVVPTGIVEIDRGRGELLPCQVGILAASTGVGKSSLMLSAALASPVKVGIISCEDGPPMMGGRLLSHFSGVNNLRFKDDDFPTAKEKAMVEKGHNRLRMDSNVLLVYPEGGTIGNVLKAAEALFDAGCRMVWLDYIQNVKGEGSDRRSEVTGILRDIQSICLEYNTCAMVVSQLRRLDDKTRKPSIHHLKESGDLENLSKLILLAHLDDKNRDIVKVHVGKASTGCRVYGCEYWRNPAGVLEPYYMRNKAKRVKEARMKVNNSSDWKKKFEGVL